MSENAVKQEIIRLLKPLALKRAIKQHILITGDKKERDYALEIFRDVNTIFFYDLLKSDLVLIYLYDIEKQPPDSAIGISDGFSSNSINRLNQTTKVSISSIGISLQALHKSKEYAIMVFLHELTHVFGYGEHDAAFYKFLDELISRYNKATGENVVNDYYGLDNAT